MKIELNSIPEKEMPNFLGGEGTFVPHMFNDGTAKIMKGRLKPHSSIGEHTHKGNCEIIFITEGHGKCLYDGEIYELNPGDATYCPEGHAHSLINDSDEDLVFFATVPEFNPGK